MNESNSKARWSHGLGRSWRICLFVFVASALVGIWLAGGFDREPRYQDKPVSYWFEHSEALADNPDPRAAEAFKTMGRSAVPFLVKTLKRRPSKMTRRLCEFAEDHDAPKWASKMLPNLDRIGDRRSAAAEIIGSLGPEASQAIPTLSRILKDPDEDEEMVRVVGDTLGGMGRANLVVLPELLENLKSTNEQVLSASVGVLGSIGNEAVAAVPSLKTMSVKADYLALCSAFAVWSITRETNFVLQCFSNLLTQSDSSLRSQTVSWIPCLGPVAKPLSPVIVHLVLDPNYVGRQTVERVLKELDPVLLQASLQQINRELPAHVEALIQIIGDEQNRNRFRAFQALSVLGPQSKSAVPALIKILGQEPVVSRPAAVHALADLYLEDYHMLRDSIEFSSLRGAGVQCTLGSTLLNGGETLQIAAARSLVQLGSAGHEAAPKLITLLQDANGRGTRVYCKALGGIGPEAREACPLLEELLAAVDPEIRLTAAEALSKIAPEQASNAVSVLKWFLNQPPVSTPTNRSYSPDSGRGLIDSLALKQEGTFPLRAAVALWRLHVEEQPPVASLLAQFAKESSLWVVELLGEIGPDAKSALPALTKSLDSDDYLLSRYAAIAIRKIDPEEAANLGLPGLFALP